MGYQKCKKRVLQHNNSEHGAKTLRGKRPVKLIYKEVYKTLLEALKKEKEIKGWRREKKLILIKKSKRSRRKAQP